mmetsp:Transcript_33913/g.52845  ORF Transcript_33913/g.52845 Transcript_33913/m.52845 type:complete len:287 (-) Transcript_33913:53-913(-)
MASDGQPIAVMGASRGTGMQCVLYMAKRKIAVKAIARDPGACRSEVDSRLPGNYRQFVTYCKADVTEPKTLAPAVRGCRGLIYAATATAGWRLPFYDNKDTPPQVDFEGAVAAATAAAAEGVNRFILVSCLSVTRPSHPMHITKNTMMGRIMDWKLLGEQGVQKVYDHVAKSSSRDMAVTIIRPGFLTDDAPEGPSGLLVDTGDSLAGSVSRADLASICVEAIWNPNAKGLVFEIVSGKQGGNYPVCTNYEQIFHTLKNGYLPVTTPSCMQQTGLRGLCSVPDTPC